MPGAAASLDRRQPRAFKPAKAAAGNDPAKLVKLALWCEQHGMRDQQCALLEQVVKLDPNNAAARGLLGQVSYQGRWETPEAVSKRMKEDEAHDSKLAEYNALRDRVERDTEVERRTVDNFERSGFQRQGRCKSSSVSTAGSRLSISGSGNGARRTGSSPRHVPISPPRSI